MHDTTMAINVGMAIVGTSWMYDGPTVEWKLREAEKINEKLINSFEFHK